MKSLLQEGHCEEHNRDYEFYCPRCYFLREKKQKSLGMRRAAERKRLHDEARKKIDRVPTEQILEHVLSTNSDSTVCISTN